MKSTLNYLERIKKQEREQGFNIHINGANEERIREQRKQELLKNQQRAHSNTDQQNQQKMRRMWKNPSSQEGMDTEMYQEEDIPKYYNPVNIPIRIIKFQFDLSAYDKQLPTNGGKSPKKLRQKWGNHPASQGNQPTKAIHQQFGVKNNDDEEDYSDSFEEVADYEEDNQQYIDEEEQREDQGSNDIEQFLRTATKFDINELRQSLSMNFNIKKENKPVNTQQDDDYIEEEFEEHDESDNDEEEKRLEEEKKKEELRKQMQQQAMISKNITSTKNAKNRPISATFNLDPTRSSKQLPEMTSGNYKQQIPTAREEIKPQKEMQYNDHKYSSNNPAIQDTPKQPNDFMKKPINTNPFKRPFSQNVGKRQDVKETKFYESQKMQQNQNRTSDQAFQSQSQKIPVQSIMTKIEQLDDWQKEKLMEILDNLDNISTSSQQIVSGNKDLKNAAQNLDLNFLSPKQQEKQKNQKEIVQPKQLQFGMDKTKNELAIKVLKTYGNPHLCGLTEIELFDTNSMKIQMVPASIAVRNLGQGPKLSLAKLIDSQKLTNDEKHMWIGYLPRPPQNLEILFYLNKDIQIGGLKIWNYNKSAIDCTKGVKEIQILFNNDIIWQGILEPGKGHKNVEYATFIKIKDDVNLPKEISTKSQKSDLLEQAIEEVYDEDEESKDNIKINQEDQEDFRKYKSVAQIKPKNEQTPLWLQSQNKSNQGQSNQIKEPERFQQKTQERQRISVQEDKLGVNTFDLLDKFSGKESTTISSQSSKGQPSSAVGSQRAHPLRDPIKQGNQQFQSAANLKPNAALGEIQSQQKKQPFEMGISNQQDIGNRQWTQPLQVQKQGQLQETSDAIKQAVNKVNELVSQHPKIKNNPVKVEESLDNLDFFKATNLGRLQSELEQNQRSTEKKPRKQWGQSPNKGLQDSQLSACKPKGAHVIVKNPFPEKQPIIKNQTNQTSRRNIPTATEDDYLDQFLNQNQPKKEIKTERPTPQQKQEDQQQFLSVLDQRRRNQASQKQSISPQRDKSPQQKSSITTQSYEEKLKTFGQDFLIPTLPMGQKLQFNILSTWGDMNYVGLTGIEIFDQEGRQVKIEESNISACPPDINILPGYGGDPRTVEKLIDGHYFTNDDLHVWLTPFTAGEDHTISIDLMKRTQIAMIRIWNYNKSRIHSYRGARLINCELDGKTVFRGEIQKAPGNVNDPANCCEIILFTENESILQKIDYQDWLNEKCIQSSMEDTQRIIQDVPSYLEERPMTATKKFSSTEMEEIQRQLRQQKPTSLFDERPQTSAIVTGDQYDSEQQQKQSQHQMSKKHQQLSNQIRQLAQVNQQSIGVRGRMIDMNIVETWGDHFYVGLNGIEVLNEKGEPYHIMMNQVNANPRDMNSIPGHGSDYRTLDKLFDKVNNTMDDHHMWLVPFNKGENHTITIDLGKQTYISAIRFYNYNKSEEDTLRGAKQVIIQIDKKYVTPKKGITLRKAPGLVHPLLDMGQDIKIPAKNGWTTEQIIAVQKKRGDLGLFQEYELVEMPMGYIFKFNLYSTHGDFYYIGLNGIELYDQNGYIIKPEKIFAEPEGVHKLTGMQSDIRVIQNVINGRNQTFEEQNMWLAPYKNTRSYSAVTSNQSKAQEDQNLEYRIPNFVCLVFDEPKAISAVRIWNYAKTPQRGVNEFEILIDDKQIYRGFAKMAPEKQEFDRAVSKDFSTVVLFTGDDKIVDKFKNNVNYDPTKQQQVGLINEKKVMNMNQNPRREDDFVVFNELQRPTTMAKMKY